MPPTKTPTWATEFAQFLLDSVKVPYESLAQHFRDSDWKYRLLQKNVTPTPDGSILVDTEIHIGRTADRLEFFDTVTLRLPPGPGPVTLVTRVQLEQSLLAVVFGRFPPQIIAAPTANAVPPPGVGQMNGGDARHVNMGDADVVLPGEDGGEYVKDDAPVVNVILKREPDGLPIFVDLYALGEEDGSTGAIIDSVLAEVDSFLKLASSVEQINALAIKNPDMKAFLKDLGDDRDRAELRSMVEARMRELTVPAAAAAAVNAPRRRVRAPQTN
jgi:hypothetical protein